MPTGRLTLAMMLASTSLVVGCAQPGSILGRRTRIGTLTASVSQLEFEKAQLARKLAEQEVENRRIESCLAQEEDANGEMAARLDDARVMLRARGYDADGLAGVGPTRRAPDGDDRPTTTPAGRSSRPGRKPPFARIPGRIDPAPPSEEPESQDDPLDNPPPRRRSEFDPQSRLDGRSHWQRVAGKTRGLALDVR
jgi:hypothetical protein